MRRDRELQCDQPPPGPKNYLNLAVQRGRIEGFLVSDYLSRAGEAIAALAVWVQAGKLKYKSTCSIAWRTRTATLRRLFDGRNDGKQFLRIAA